MSHFSLAVITKEDNYGLVMDMMNPFDENRIMKPYVEYTREGAVADEKESLKKRIKNVSEGLKKLKAKEEKDDNLIERIESLEKQLANDQEKLKTYTDEDYYEEKRQWWEDDMVNENGDLLSTYNPDSKYDYYVVGGRWENSLKVKEDKLSEYPDNHKGYVDSAKVSDVDFFYVDPVSAVNSGRFWDITVEGAPLKEGEEEPFSLYNKDYYLERYKTRDNFIKTVNSFRTYAILTPDSKWHEPGQMGYWGMNDASVEDEVNFDKNYFNILDLEKYKDCYITVIDCHI